MKQALLLSILILSFTAGFSQKAVLSLTKNTIVYCGIPNPIDIAVPGYSCDEIYLTTTNGVLANDGPCSYILTPDNSSHSLYLTIYDTAHSEIDKFQMRIKSIQYDSRFAGLKTKGTIHKRRLLLAPIMSIQFSDGTHINGISLRVDSFNIEVYDKDSIYLSTMVPSNKLDSNSLKIIDQLPVGEYKMWFSNIYAYRNCEGVFQVPEMFLILHTGNSIARDKTNFASLSDSGLTIHGHIKNLCQERVAYSKVYIRSSSDKKAFVRADASGYFQISGVTPGSDIVLQSSDREYFSNETQISNIHADTTINIFLHPFPKEDSWFPVLTFTHNSDSLEDSTRAALNDIIYVLKRHPNIQMQVISYIDTTENSDISEKRLDLVVEYILSHCVDTSNILTAFTTIPIRTGDNEFDCKTKRYRGNTLATEEYIETIKDPKEQEKLRTRNRRIYFRIWDPF